MSRSYSGGRAAALTAAIFFLLADPLWAQLPKARLSVIYPSGAHPGSTVEVTIGGADLDEVTSLRFSHPGITAGLKTAEPSPSDLQPNPLPNRFVVRVAEDVPLGAYEVRAAGRNGVTNPRLFTIGDEPETVESEPNDAVDSATEISPPVAICGRLDRAADVDYYRFVAEAGQRILVRCHTRQADSRVDALVTVYDATGREFGSSRDPLGSGPLVDFTAPAAGEYFVKIHDTLFQGGDEYGYRLSVGALPHIDYIFPPAGLAGRSQAFTIFGRNLPRAQLTDLTVDGRPLEKLDVFITLPDVDHLEALTCAGLLDTAGVGLDGIPYRVKGSSGWSAPYFVGVTAASPVLEQEPNQTAETAQTLSVPCEVMAQFYPKRDSDWYQFTAEAGQSYTIEVISQRTGCPTDASLLIEEVPAGASGGSAQPAKQLAMVHDSGDQDGGPDFDTRNHDPVYRFTAPAAATYRILVFDHRNTFRGDPRRVYRLAILRDQPDFRLVAVAEGSDSAAMLRKGERTGIHVVAFRRPGFEGEIQLTATGLPAGIMCSDATIGPGRNAGTLILTAGSDAAPAAASIQVTGTAQIGARTVTRRASFGTSIPAATPSQRYARLAGDLVVSVSAEETFPLSLEAGGGRVWETCRAGTLKIPYTCPRPHKGKINVTPKDLPAGIDLRNFAISPNARSGEFEVKLRNNAPTGTLTFYLAAVAEKFSYSRNPEAAARAARRKQEVDKMAADAAAAAKSAAAKAKSAAKDAKAQAEKAAAEAADRAKAAAELKTRTDKLAADAANAARPKPINVPLVSTPITLRIAPAPVTLSVDKPARPMTPGRKLEIPVRITRLYDYNGQVSLSLVVPPGAKGITAPKTTIPAGKTEANLIAAADSAAVAGRHDLLLRASLSLNNQNLSVDEPVTLEIQQAQQAARK